MYIFRPKNSNGLVIATDWRSKSDRQLDFAERGYTHVLEYWKFGKEVLGKREWDRTTRVALFDHGATPTAEDAAQARREWTQFLNIEVPRCVVVLESPGKGQQADKWEEDKPLSGTNVWQALGAPDSMKDMRGTFWDSHGLGCGPILAAVPVFKRTKELQKWALARWLQWALRMNRAGEDSVTLATCPRKSITPGKEMYDHLLLMVGKPLAVDIEAISSKDLITAIGVATVSDGAVSLPWDPYVPYLETEMEPGWEGYPVWGPRCHGLLCTLLGDPQTPKIFHNYKFDVGELRDAGVTVNGSIHDTMAAHMIAYPELRHGLQHACASLFPSRPWKSTFHPKVGPGITRDDPEWWMPKGVRLRGYNGDDSFFTALAAQDLLPAVEVYL